MQALAPAELAPLPSDLAGRLHAAPLLPDVAAAVAELVSNSLDAGAHRICVRLLTAGRNETAFAVDDDGCGIDASSFAALGRHGHTSKQQRADPQLAGDACTLGFKVSAIMRVHAGAGGRQDHVGSSMQAATTQDTMRTNSLHAHVLRTPAGPGTRRVGAGFHS